MVRLSVDEAKLVALALRDRTLPRTALIDRLVATSDARLVTLIAAPGYGKSTTLALWRARESRPTAWLTLDERDADPYRLISGLIGAIDGAIGIEVASLAGVEVSGVSALATLVPRFTSGLHRASSPLVLMVDELQRIDGSPSVDALAMIVDYLPPGTTVALAGRSDAGLPMARFRVSGGLLEVTERDLAFDLGESAELARLHDASMSEAGSGELQAATEGWPAAVYLAIRGRAQLRDGQREPKAPPSGRDREIAAYLDDEILGKVSSSTRTFLLQTSFLGRLTGELCDAVTGRQASARMLERLATENHLVMPVGRIAGEFRYHTLLAEHLQGLLERTSTDIAALHRRAAAWYEARGFPESAIDHYLAAGDLDAAARVLTPVALSMYRSGHIDTFLARLDQLGPDGLRRDPILAVIGGWVHALNGRAAATDRLADLFEAAAYPGVPPPGAESYETARGALRALMARAGLAAAIDEAERAVALEPRSSAWRPIALAVLGSALAVGGDRERSDVIYRETIEVAPESGAGRALATAWSGRAILAIERADWASAHAFARRGMEAVDRYGLTGDVTVAWAAAVAARAALDRGAADEARRHLARFQVARPALSVATPWLSARCLLEASRAVLANADPAGARALLFQAEDILVRRADLGDLPDQVAALRKRIRDLPPGPGGASTLTPAEIRVLRLLPTYLSVPEIAHRLFVTPNTIRTQIQAIYGKLGASSRSEAVERAVEVGLVEPLPILADDEITRP